MFDWLFKAEPFDEGYLPETDGHCIYYHQYGQADGPPILCFHAGPGSRSKAKHAKRFDLKKYRVILFDQRGCGQSTYDNDLTDNTTDDILNDADRLVDHLGLKHYHLYGGSWGSTCALLYAIRHPKRVLSLMILQVALARSKDKAYIQKGMAPHYPDIQDALLKPVPDSLTLSDYYTGQILDGTPQEQAEATRLYGSWEYMLGNLSPKLPKTMPDADAVQSFRIFMHYDHNDYFLDKNQILNTIDAIKDIPTMIVHNRLDYLCPLEGAWTVDKALNNSDLVIVPSRGHVSNKLYRTARRSFDRFLTKHA